MKIGKQFVWTKEETDFLKDNYNIRNNKDLSDHFKISRGIIIHKANSLGLRKTYRISCKDCGKKIITENHNVARCPKCQKEFIRKTGREKLRKLRKEHPQKLKEIYRRWYERRGLFVMSRYKRKIKEAEKTKNI